MTQDDKLQLVTEGKARFRAFLLPGKDGGEAGEEVEGGLDKWEQRGVPTRSMPVFYNPAMAVNRNISVLAVNAWRGKSNGTMNICDAMCGVTMILYLEPHGSRMILFAPAGDAEPASHVLESTLEAFRSGNSFVSYADKNGTFRCILGDGQELAGDQLVPPPPSIPLTDWDLVVKHRRASGEVIDVVQHHVKPEDWRKNKRLKYCSGPGHYSTVLTLPDDYFTGCRLLLSLGRVHDVATVTVNGTVVKTLLIPPYDVDITALVKRNETNTIEVDVTGTMRNMLVGYGKKHGKPWKHHKRQGTMPMGIIGPACIKAQHVVRYSKNN